MLAGVAVDVADGVLALVVVVGAGTLVVRVVDVGQMRPPHQSPMPTPARSSLWSWESSWMRSPLASPLPAVLELLSPSARADLAAAALLLGGVGPVATARTTTALTL